MAAIAAALVPDATASKILAAALEAAAVLIGYNNAAGRGIIIAFVGIFPNGTAHWISSQ